MGQRWAGEGAATETGTDGSAIAPFQIKFLSTVTLLWWEVLLMK